MENVKTIAVCDNPFIADVIRDKLAEQGIACMVVDQTMLGVQGGYGPMPGFGIRVYEKDEACAKAIADEIMANR